MTNYERIKSMSVEELAVAIRCPNELGMAEIECGSEDRGCYKCCLEWLPSDVAEESR